MIKQLLAATLIVATLAMTNSKKKKILFFGDSITQMGVNKGGYIDLLNDRLLKTNMQQGVELIGAGIGGNKVYDLYLRMPEDVLSKKPNTVVVWVGVNDVWHKTSLGTGTDLDKFEKFYKAIIKLLQAKKIAVVLTTPAAIGEKYDGTNPQDKDLDTYSDVIRKLAAGNSCKLVDLRSTFMQYEKKYNNENKESGLLTTDRVHLTVRGNELVAEEMAKALF